MPGTFSRWLASLAALLACAASPAQTSAPQAPSATPIVIDQGNVGAIQIAVVPFAWQSAGLPPGADQDVAKVIRADLNRVGTFRALSEDRYIDLPSTLTEVNFDTWKLMKQQYVVVGRVLDHPAGGFRIEFQLARTADGQSLLGQALIKQAGDLRSAGHEIADAIYEQITKVRGAFSTRIAYVMAQGSGRDMRYRLVVADADGFNPQSVVQSAEPLLSVAWAPDGKQLAYVSFERGNSAIYTQDISTGARRLVSSFKGINGAPAYSPDGSKLALTLSRSGNPEINVYDFASNQYTQLTRHFSIDTEPVWTPDGREILFTSDRSGKPQIYRINAGGGDAQRVTSMGEYNARATVSYDGRMIAMVQGNRNVYRIAVLDRTRGEPGENRVLTPRGTLDETPSFAPNASMVLYASREGTRGVLHVASVGKGTSVIHRVVYADVGDFREPAWGPFRQR